MDDDENEDYLRGFQEGLRASASGVAFQALLKWARRNHLELPRSLKELCEYAERQAARKQKRAAAGGPSPERERV